MKGMPLAGMNPFEQRPVYPPWERHYMNTYIYGIILNDDLALEEEEGVELIFTVRAYSGAKSKNRLFLTVMTVLDLTVDDFDDLDEPWYIIVSWSIVRGRMVK